MRGIVQNVVLLCMLLSSLSAFAQSEDLFMKIWKAKDDVKLSAEASKSFEHFKNQKMEILNQIKELESKYYKEQEKDKELKSKILKLYSQKHHLINEIKQQAIKNKDEALFLELMEHIRPKDLTKLLQEEKLNNARHDLYRKWMESIQHTAIGSQLKDFKLMDENGVELNTADLRGKILWIDSWASKCGPCIKKLKQIKRAYEKYQPKGFEILAVSWDYTVRGYIKTKEEAKTDWLKVMKKHEFNWVNVFDTGDQIMGGQFGSVGKNLLIDAKGTIIGFDLHPLEIEALLEK
ncbi:TlpA family protein disulfide reductase [Marinifilum flexuosum]|uniref:TlpA family protein disulfide reductase n=1 Tax=Marinifilum flexuosum TaxID=1117708 RepID=UPI0024926DD6|nr:TlpA disulfide reductase family protein [Marinifilum flexuosum]